VRDRQEWFDGAHEAIVDVEVFASVEAMRINRKRRGHGGGRPVVGAHLLTGGLLRCSCGAAMRPRSNIKADGGRWDAYICSGRNSGETPCTRSAVAREPIDTAVWRYVEDVAIDYEATLADARHLRAIRLAEVETQIAAAEHEHVEATARYERVRRDYADGRLTADAWLELRDDLRAAADAAGSALDRLLAHHDLVAREIDLTAIEDEVMARVGEIRAALAGMARNVASLPAAREALRAVFDRFVLHDDRDPPDLFDGDLARPREGWIIEPVPRADAIFAPRAISYDTGDPTIRQEEVLRRTRIASGLQPTDSSR
jgi:hypothetical protein